MHLRQFTVDDASRVAELVDDEGIARWTSKIPHPYTVQDAREWIRSTATNPDRNPFAVVVEGEIVACVSWWPDGEDSVEVGYWVGRDYWGAGICPRALAAMMALPGFPRHQRVVAKVLSENLPSRRVLEKCGFAFQELCTIERDGQPAEARLYQYQPRGAAQ